MLVHNLLEESANKYPNKNAVWYKDNWATYSDININSDKIATYLIQNNINRGDRVAILSDNSIDYVNIYFGILKAGGVVVGLNGELMIDSLSYLINNSDSKIVITDNKYLPKLLAAVKDVKTSIIITKYNKEIIENNDIINSSLEEIYESNNENISVRSIDLDLAEIVYTSGSTGEPKGVMLSHLNLVSNMYSIVKYLHLTEDDSVMVILPFYYIYGKSLLLTTFLSGGSVVIENRFTYPNVVLDTMEKMEVTGFAGVPSTFSILLNRSTLKKKNFTALRYVTQAGGAMAPTLQKEVVKAFDPAVLYVMYGATEAAPRLSYVEPSRLPEKWGSIGIPVDNVDLVIMDSDGKELPIGEEGEIAARGSNIMNGYWKDPIGTNDVLKNGYYLTGDLGKKDKDGFFYVVGRKKNIIKVKGFRVSAKHIEEAILEMTEVDEVAVIGISDPDLGEAVKAFIILKNDKSLDINDIRKFLQPKLAQYEIPKYIDFVESLPKNKSGKILKTELKK